MNDYINEELSIFSHLVSINDKRDEIVLHLNLINGIGPVVINFLTQSYTLSYDQLLVYYDFVSADFVSLGFSKKIADILYAGLRNKKRLEQEYMLLKKHTTIFLTPFNILYPKNLQSVENKPPVLYVMTENIKELSQIKKNLSCVGSRAANDYAKKSLIFCIDDIENDTLRIISGGAIGGDTIAHETALKNNIITYSVFGSGLMHWYPASNYGLFKKILEKGGALLSPFCMDTQPSKNTFPSRNNVIAGISDAIVVIQAAKKSGTFITAQAGLEFGRNIGIIPGPIHDLLSQGGYELIRQGASLVTNKNDIYELLSLNNDMKKNENINIEQKIINFCLQERLIEEIINEFNINKNDAMKILFDLLRKKLIMQDVMGKWKKR